MQDGGGGALRGAAAPAGSGGSRFRDERPGLLGAAGGNRQRRARGRRAGREGERRAGGTEEGGPGQRPPGTERARGGGSRGGPGAGSPRGGTGPARAGLRRWGTDCASFALSGSLWPGKELGGGFREEKSQRPSPRPEQGGGLSNLGLLRGVNTGSSRGSMPRGWRTPAMWRVPGEVGNPAL